MSQENVEVVRRLMDIMRDRASERIADFWEPDGDYYPVRKFPESRPCHGPDEIQSFMAEYECAWKNYEFIVKEAHPVGDDRVFLHRYIRAEGRESGAALEGDIYQCFWLRHGRFVQAGGSPHEEGPPSRPRAPRRFGRGPRSRGAVGVGGVAGGTWRLSAP
ncbi:MAG: nuclear transport factor 2 family protein [Thermoleophilaceae bacterium]